MNHDEWVRSELRQMGQSLGFKYTPAEEIENRLAKVRVEMKKMGLESLLVLGKMNLFYLTGTTQDGLLFVPQDAKPLLVIRTELARAQVESPLDQVVSIQPGAGLPSLIKQYCGGLPNTVGLELDILPVKDFFRYRGLFPRINFLV
jgi:Xaa-Pro aminopeptidase